MCVYAHMRRRFKGLAFAMMATKAEGQHASQFIEQVVKRRQRLHQALISRAQQRAGPTGGLLGPGNTAVASRKDYAAVRSADDQMPSSGYNSDYSVIDGGTDTEGLGSEVEGEGDVDGSRRLPPGAQREENMSFGLWVGRWQPDAAHAGDKMHLLAVRHTAYIYMYADVCTYVYLGMR
jgi:hypothetical protein